MPDEERTCDCTGGFREVTEVYARQEAGIPQDADMDAYRRAAIDTPEHAAWCKFAAIANSVYPCPTCRPGQFKKWRNGCYQPNHHRKTCRTCTPRDEAHR